MKLNPLYDPPKLWDWLADRLPPSLEPAVFVCGYGRFYGIYRRGEKPSFIKRSFEMTGDPVAEVCENELRLNHPEYFSDFEDLLKRWESETGIEATLSFWQSPKDKMRSEPQPD